MGRRIANSAVGLARKAALTALFHVPRQNALHTSGPATVAAGRYLVDRGRAKEVDIYRICEATEECGSSRTNVVRALAFAFNTNIQSGLGSWHGSPAATEIKDAEYQCNRFVLLLRRSGTDICFYDPVYGVARFHPAATFPWADAGGSETGWIANIPVTCFSTLLVGEASGPYIPLTTERTAQLSSIDKQIDILGLPWHGQIGQTPRFLNAPVGRFMDQF